MKNSKLTIRNILDDKVNLDANKPNHSEFISIIETCSHQELVLLANKFATSNPPAKKLLIVVMAKLYDLYPSDPQITLGYANTLSAEGTHRALAKGRDIILNLLEMNREIYTIQSTLNENILRVAAIRCYAVGPKKTALKLLKILINSYHRASDYSLLSEALAEEDKLQESIDALSCAIELDPETHDTADNRDTIQIARNSLKSPLNASIEKIKTRKKIARYPETKDFLGDSVELMLNHIAVNFGLSNKFINKNTKFFTLGSCFARNIGLSLIKNGYHCEYLEISETINTSFANRALIDWIKNPSHRNDINKRISELIPAGVTNERILDLIRQSDVFILTLGVAPAFFDRITNNFVMPKASSLNMRALAENYIFRTTTVKENVDNILYIINFIKELSPEIKIIITVSPVPIFASFEFESCVQADCLSKSILRVAAHQIVNECNLNNVFYWPSFELFRWAGSNASEFYAADDGAAWHVTEEKVSDTIKAFISTFSADSK
jgi:tetratricopeptide (TPR) repeat protein